MAQLKFGAAGVTTREIDLTGPVAQAPTGVPAAVVGTSLKGPAFVPVTVGIFSDWKAKFGNTDGIKFGPLAVNEWLKNAGSVTYLRVLGAGDARQNNSDGSVNSAGFTVGENEPNTYAVLGQGDGTLVGNIYANSGTAGTGGAGPNGRTYFLGAFMSESFGSTVFSSAGLQGTGSLYNNGNVSSSVAIVRGVLMAASGVILRLSSSLSGSGLYSNNQPASTLIANETNASGSTLGDVVLFKGSVPKMDFVMLLNGHQGLDPNFPNVITASFDTTSPNYFASVFNTDPLKLNKAGHYLYASWDIHPSTAVVTSSGLFSATLGAGGPSNLNVAAFLTTSSLARNVGSAFVPNYEAFTNRFQYARSPWIISQKFGGSPQNLFRLWALDAGAGVSTLYKVSIENLVVSPDLMNKYGSFDVVLRDWNDNDTTPRVLEAWRGLSLNPSDDRYIAKVIGDTNVFFDFNRQEAQQKIVVNGNYANNSNLVRVEVSTNVDQGLVDPTALPFGFRGAQHLQTSGSQPMPAAWSGGYQTSAGTDVAATLLNKVIQAPVPMRTNITIGAGAKQQVNPLLYWGTQFEHITSVSTPNQATLKNNSLLAFAKYFPDFNTTNANVLVGDNAGAADTTQNGVADSDRFNLNLFTLENIQVVTGTAGTADPTQWQASAYVRNGNIPVGGFGGASNTRRLNVSDITIANRRFLKYTLFMQGGFDGVNIFDLDQTQINNNAVVADMNTTNRNRNNGSSVRAYQKAIDIMANVVNTDVQLLAIPGIRHPVVTNYAVTNVENRFDALFIMDIEQIDNSYANVTQDTQLPSVQNTAAQFQSRGLDSSFAAAYFPDALVQDPTTKTNLYVPPSVVVLGAFALNDAIGHTWFAPAGFTRGALASTLEARVKLSKGNMDSLYDVNINPLVAFPGNATSGTNPKGGVLVWGQRTLQAAASALDRVNVRRLLIDIRRQVRDISQTIVFEPNRAATLAQFSAKVTPRLQRIQAQAGLDRFRVVIDSSTTTQADIDNNTIRGKVYVQPVRSIEYVSVDFVVTNNIQ